MNQDTSSSTNTVLLVIVLLILVGFGVWWFAIRGNGLTPAPAQSGINVDVNLPSGNNAPSAQ